MSKDKILKRGKIKNPELLKGKGRGRGRGGDGSDGGYTKKNEINIPTIQRLDGFCSGVIRAFQFYYKEFNTFPSMGEAIYGGYSRTAYMTVEKRYLIKYDKKTKRTSS